MVVSSILNTGGEVYRLTGSRPAQHHPDLAGAPLLNQGHSPNMPKVVPIVS